MRQGTSNSTGKWWASAGCAGLVIASAFIGATLYLGGPPTRAASSGEQPSEVLTSGPDPVQQGSPGPSLVRRKGSPLWPQVTTTEAPASEEVTDLAEGESEGFVVRSSSTSTTTTTTTTTTTERPSTTKTAPHRHRAVKEPTFRAQDLDWDQIINNVNRSLSPRLNQRLRDIANLDPAALIKNTSSLVSFGLLAVDLFLLHNVQRIAFTENAGKQLSEDPEVVALNSLFDGATASGERKQRSGGVVGEVLGFLQGAVRGVVNLGRAYRRAHTGRARSVGSPTTLDCIWTLYCRNLDKTAKIGGPYGFLARMNSLGLRLMLGEFAPEDALERLMSDMSTSGSKLDCNTLFPRCGAEEAKRVVLATAQGDRGTQV